MENDISRDVIGCAIEIHKAMGPGLLESTYLTCLAYELRQKGYFIEEQLGLPLIYKGVEMEIGYRLDLLVEKKVIIEIKSVEKLNDVHTAQILTYLKLSGASVGLLINFNVLALKEGIRRLVSKDFLRR
jgi:GxxExxY protein